MCKGFASAVAFLTILPVPARFCDAKGFASCARYFPAAGLLLGGLCAFGGGVFSLLWSPLVAALLAILLLAVLSGGLHLDGLADTADGFCSARPREAILEIMRDSRIGTMGALALFFVLGVKILALASLDTLPGTFWGVLLLLPVVGRVVILLLRELLPYARSAGLGADAGGVLGRGTLLFWVALLAIGSLVLLGGQGVWAVLAGFLAAGALAWVAKRKIGGYTGDVLGASCEIGEAAFLLALAV